MSLANEDKEKDACLKLYRGVLSQVPNFNTNQEFVDDFESTMDLIGLVRSFCYSVRNRVC